MDIGFFLEDTTLVPVSAGFTHDVMARRLYGMSATDALELRKVIRIKIHRDLMAIESCRPINHYEKAMIEKLLGDYEIYNIVASVEDSYTSITQFRRIRTVPILNGD